MQRERHEEDSDDIFLDTLLQIDESYWLILSDSTTPVYKETEMVMLRPITCN